LIYFDFFWKFLEKYLIFSDFGTLWHSAHVIKEEENGNSRLGNLSATHPISIS